MNYLGHGFQFGKKINSLVYLGRYHPPTSIWDYVKRIKMIHVLFGIIWFGIIFGIGFIMIYQNFSAAMGPPRPHSLGKAVPELPGCRLLDPQRWDPKSNKIHHYDIL